MIARTFSLGDAIRIEPGVAVIFFNIVNQIVITHYEKPRLSDGSPQTKSPRAIRARNDQPDFQGVGV